MKHGIFLPPFGSFGDPAILIDLAVAAEKAGWDGFFVWDHLMHRINGPYVDAWIALAAIAARTERIRVGPLVTPLPRRRPWKLAREAVSVDHLSRGRLILGVGIGTDHSKEFSAFGEPSDDRTRAELFDESLEIVTELWAVEPTRFSGTHFHVTAWSSSPVPSSSPASRSGAPCSGPIALLCVEPPATTASPRSASCLPTLSRTSSVKSGATERRSTRSTSPSCPRRPQRPRTPTKEAGATWWLEAFQPDTPLQTAQQAVQRGPTP